MSIDPLSRGLGILFVWSFCLPHFVGGPPTDGLGHDRHLPVGVPALAGAVLGPRRSPDSRPAPRAAARPAPHQEPRQSRMDSPGQPSNPTAEFQHLRCPFSKSRSFTGGGELEDGTAGPRRGRLVPVDVSGRRLYLLVPADRSAGTGHEDLRLPTGATVQTQWRAEPHARPAGPASGVKIVAITHWITLFVFLSNRRKHFADLLWIYF